MTSALYQLHHNNVVHFFGIYFEKEHVYFVMELMAGSLTEVIIQFKKFLPLFFSLN
jgi:serine/threonine protein kinase